MKVSGGVSNLSFSFRGNDVVREAIHSAFLFHAIKAGMDMGIVNAGQLVVYEDIAPDLLERVEDIIFNRRPDATERLVEFAATVKGAAKKAERDLEWRAGTVEARLSHALVHGIVDFIEEDVEEARAKYPRPLDDHRGPADGRHEGGRRPVRRRQDVPAAGGEERAGDEEGGRVPAAVHGAGDGRQGSRAARARIVLATVKGDVHDIGKNIVGVVLGCNSYEVVDLGVMVPADRILQTAIDQQADLVGLSGLITPSLDEMVFVAKEMERREFRTPLLIGGATTSRQHTAVKIAPEYSQRDGPRPRRVARGRRRVEPAESDASGRASSRPTGAQQATLREQHSARRERPLLSYQAALENRLADRLARADGFRRRRRSDGACSTTCRSVKSVPYIDWTFFFAAWELKGRFPAILDHPQYGAAARDLYDNARALLDRIVAERLLQARGVYGFWPAASDGDDIVVFADESRSDELMRFNMLRQQEAIADGKPNLSLADFVADARSRAPPITSARLP